MSWLLCCPLQVIAMEQSPVFEQGFANGLKVLVREDHRSPVVVSQVWYKVGSSYEPQGLTGVSHMLEHMMFKGTKKYPAGEFSRIIADNGGQENAFTGMDYTAYFQTLEKSRLEISFMLESDRMRNLDLQAQELEKELQVVTEERRLRTDDQPREKTQEQFNAVAYTTSPYRHPIIGWPSDIASYTVDDLKNWYQKWYAPNNATLVVVGDVNHDEVFKLAAKYFEKIKPSVLPQMKPQVELAQVGVRRLTVKAPAKLPYVMMGFKVPVLKTVQDDWEAYALEVLAGVLDGGSGSRLTANLVRGQQVAVSVAAGYDLTARLPSLFSIEATPAEGKSMSEIESALLNQVASLRDELVDPEELQRVKAQVLANNVYQKDSNFYQAMQLGMLETVGVGWKKGEDYVAKVNQVTAEQVQKVAQKYLVQDGLTIAYLEPQPISRESKPAKLTGVRHGF